MDADPGVLCGICLQSLLQAHCTDAGSKNGDLKLAVWMSYEAVSRAGIAIAWKFCNSVTLLSSTYLDSPSDHITGQFISPFQVEGLLRFSFPFLVEVFANLLCYCMEFGQHCISVDSRYQGPMIA